MKDKSKKRSIFVIFSMILSVILSLSAMIFIYMLWDNEYGYEDYFLLIIVASGVIMYLSYIFHVFVHESGHMLFGWLTGYRLVSFKIFNVVLVRINGKIKRKKAVIIPGILGQCIMSPKKIKNGKAPFVILYLGGSLLNFIVGGVFLALYYALYDFPFLCLVMITFAIIGFLFGALNILPMNSGIADNDGLNTIRLAKVKGLLRSFLIQLKILEQLVSGVRLKEMPEEWFYIPSDDSLEGSLGSANGIMTYTRLFELGKIEEATKLIDSMLAPELGICGLHRALLIQDRIYAELIGNGDRELVKTLLSSKERGLIDRIKNDITPLRIKYTVALLYENNSDKAEYMEREFNMIASTYPYPAEVEQEKELMAMAKARYDAKIKEKEIN